MAQPAYLGRQEVRASVIAAGVRGHPQQNPGLERVPGFLFSGGRVRPLLEGVCELRSLNAAAELLPAVPVRRALNRCAPRWE